MEVFRTESTVRNRIQSVLYRDSGDPVANGDCTVLPIKVSAISQRIAGTSELARRVSQYGNIVFTDDERRVPRVLYHKDDGERIDDYVKRFTVNLSPQKSNAQKRREAQRWRKAKENDDIVINPIQSIRAEVEVIAKPGVNSPIVVSVVHPVRQQCHRTRFDGTDGFTYQCGVQGNPKDPLVAGHPLTGEVTAYGGRINTPLSSGYNQEWANGLVADIRQELLTQQRVDRGLATKVLASANTRGVDLVANLGELPETLLVVRQMIKGYMKAKKQVRTRIEDLDVKKGLRKQLLAKARRQGNLRSENYRALAAQSERNSIKVLDAVSTLWMGNRYGAQPIGFTIRDIMKELSSKYRHFQTDRAGIRKDRTLTFMGVDHPYEQISRVWLRRRYDVKRHILDQAFFLDMPTAAWELLPVSFITDWFLNVGDVISACAYPDIEFTDVSSCSWKDTGVIEFETATAYVTIKFESYVLRPTRLAEHISLQFDPNMTLKRVVDAAALSWFAFRSRNGLGDR